MGSIIVFLTGVYPIFEHYYPPNDSQFCDVCTIVLLIDIFTAIFGVMSLVFLSIRLYYSLWKGRMARPEVLFLQTTITLVLFIAFMEMFMLPARFIPEKSEMAKAIKNLVAMPGILYAGLITFKLMKIVNTNMKFDFRK